jgi:hypothetical protein
LREFDFSIKGTERALNEYSVMRALQQQKLKHWESDLWSKKSIVSKSSTPDTACAKTAGTSAGAIGVLLGTKCPLQLDSERYAAFVFNHTLTESGSLARATTVN